jgi:hypothetical protein
VIVDVFERYATLDPARDPDNQPEWNTAATALLLMPNGREPNMETLEQTPQEKTPRRTLTGMLVAASAAPIVLILGAGTLLVNGGDSDTAPTQDTAPVTPVAADSNSSLAVTEADALAVVNNFFVAHNVGEGEELMTLFAPGATFRSNYEGDTSYEDQEMLFAWDAAQGTIITSQGCAAETAAQETITSVTCSGAKHDSLSRALSAPPVPFTIKIEVTPEGISHLEYRYGSPDFDATGAPFLVWMRVHNPDDVSKMVFRSWETFEEASEYGELSARYAAEWATYLDENNCTFKDRC